MQENEKDHQIEVQADEAPSAEEIRAQPGSVDNAPEPPAADMAPVEAPVEQTAEEVASDPVPAEQAAEPVVPAEAQTGDSLAADAAPGHPAADETETPAGPVETLSADELLAPDAAGEQPKWPAEDAELLAMLEAIIYITDEPLTMEQIAAALEQPRERIRRLLDELVAEWQKPHHGLSIREVAGGYKMATKPEHHEAVRQFVKNLKAPMKLSLPALETLAVIAYKQPVTAPEIMEIRGVQGAGVLKTLIERKLIAPAGRKNVIGKPILYKTTREFLVQFGLKDLSELPSVKEFEELSRLSTPEPQPAPEETAAAETAPAADATAGEPSPPLSEAPAVEQEQPAEPAAEPVSETPETPEAAAAEEPPQQEPVGETVAE
jgi:segregation and condensation protein B